MGFLPLSFINEYANLLRIFVNTAVHGPFSPNLIGRRGLMSGKKTNFACAVMTQTPLKVGHAEARHRLPELAARTRKEDEKEE